MRSIKNNRHLYDGCFLLECDYRIGFQKTQIYQWFAGSRQEVFILYMGSYISVNIYAANLLLNFTAEWGILCLKGADRYAEH